jgi:hypothetical protein
MFKLEITASGADIFKLPKIVKIKGTKSEGRPMLHRLAANLVNLAAASAQEAVVEQMGKNMIIRRYHHKGRFPSFIQNQVKIAKFAYAKDFPNISAELVVSPTPSKTLASRQGASLILDRLEEGGLREPLTPGAKRVAVPTIAETREGGSFEGKVETKHQHTKIMPKFIKVRAGRGSEQRHLKVKRTTFIYLSRSWKGKRSVVLRYDPGEKRGKVLYSYHESVKQPRKFYFFGVAETAIVKALQGHFNDLISEMGILTRNLISKFKWQRFSDMKGGK